MICGRVFYKVGGMLIQRAPDLYEKLRHLGGMATDDVLDASPGPPTEMGTSRQDTPYRGEELLGTRGKFPQAPSNFGREVGGTGKSSPEGFPGILDLGKRC